MWSERHGRTALTVYGAGKRVIYSSDVLVSADLESFQGTPARSPARESQCCGEHRRTNPYCCPARRAVCGLQQILTLADTYDPASRDMMSVQGHTTGDAVGRFVEMERKRLQRICVSMCLRTAPTPILRSLSGPAIHWSNAVQIAASTFGRALLGLGVWAAAT